MGKKQSPCNHDCVLFIGFRSNETEVRCCRKGKFRNHKPLRRGRRCKHKIKAQERFDRTGSYLPL